MFTDHQPMSSPMVRSITGNIDAVKCGLVDQLSFMFPVLLKTCVKHGKNRRASKIRLRIK